jgi:hypothetical protein
VLVEPLQAEIRDVDDLRSPVHGEVRRDARDRGSPHHPVASRGGDGDAVDPPPVGRPPGPRIGRWSGVKSIVAAQIFRSPGRA